MINHRKLHRHHYITLPEHRNVNNNNVNLRDIDLRDIDLCDIDPCDMDLIGSNPNQILYPCLVDILDSVRDTQTFILAALLIGNVMNVDQELNLSCKYMLNLNCTNR